MTVKVKDAARLLDMPPQLLRVALQQGKFPFGVAVKRGRWSYYINRGRLEQWMKGEEK